MKKIYNILLLFIFIVIGNASFGQSTSNCGYAGTAITVGSSCTTVAFNTSNNTNTWTSAAGCNASPSYDDAWWWFTATATSTTITYNSTNDAILHLFTGACSATMSYLTCADNTSSGNETITYATTIGTNYAIRIQRYDSDDSMNGTICVYNTPIPAGCTPNTTIASIPYVQTGFNTSGSGDDFSSSNACGSSYMNGDDYVFTYTPSANECVNIALTNTSTYVGVFVTNGCPSMGGVSCVASNTNSAGNPSISSVSLTAGVTYFITVSTWPSPQTTPFDISITACPPPPSNDLCSGATNLPCGTTALAGTTVNTTNTAHGTTCTMSNYGVWYSFVGDGNNTTITVNNSYDIELSISSGSCGTFTNVVCTDSPENHTFATVNGVTYFVYVAYYSSGSSTTGTFTISRSCSAPPVAPANDLCSGATNLPCGTSALAGTTVNSTNTAHGTACSMSNYGVWYSFVGDGNNTTITVNNSYDIELSISSGSCGTFTNVVCSDFPEDHTFTTVNGVTYYVYVAGWLTGDTETGTFDISRTCAAPPVPTCSDGIQNGDETAVDCGGTVCNPCIVPAEVCEDANPFCSDLVYNFPTTVDAGDAVVGPDYGCLGDQPNPVWYYLLVDANGDLEIEIASDCGDVDYAAWGPFSSTTCDNSDLTTSGNFMYEFYGASTYSEVDAFSAPSGNMVDCSYDIDAIEYLYISNAVIGEYYVVLITNYDNCDGLLTFSQISGSGSSNCNIVLPVKLMSFTAKAMENYNILDWQTATEVNNDYFVVESSTDMISFKEIGRVDGAGNSNNVISYQYLDYTSFDKVIYYRLKQVDFDGVYTFSDIVAVKKSNEGDVNIYPNPAKEALFLDINSKKEEQFTIRFVNVLGAVVQENIVVNKGTNTYQSKEFKQLQTGIYFVQLLNAKNETVKNLKIVKE